MCGLFGYYCSEIGTEAALQLRAGIIRALAVANEKRGEDASGLAAVTGNGISTVKQAIPAGDLVFTHAGRALLNQSSTAIIGHARLPTIGANTAENAHPFTFGKVVGAHNGRVANYKEVFPGAEVDSEAIFFALAKREATLNDAARAMSKLEGLVTVTWYDSRARKVRLFCSGTYSLYYVWSQELHALIWSSEAVALRAAGAAYGLNFCVQKLVTNNICELLPMGGMAKREAKVREWSSQGFYHQPTHPAWPVQSLHGAIKPALPPENSIIHLSKRLHSYSDKHYQTHCSPTGEVDMESFVNCAQCFADEEEGYNYE